MNDPQHKCLHEADFAQMAADIREIRKAMFEGNGHPSLFTRLALIEAKMLTISYGWDWYMNLGVIFHPQILILVQVKLI